MQNEFIPKSYEQLSINYTTALFKKDLFAGITVGLIALPLSIAYAIASGATPEQGLTTAIIAGFTISVLGGSSVSISGSTATFATLIYKILHQSGYETLALTTLIGACFLILFGLFRLGTIIKYVPNSLIVGLTAGIAVVIFSTQVKDFFGLSMGTVPVDFVSKWKAYSQTFSTAKASTTLLAMGTLLFTLLIRHFFPNMPWGIAAIGAATAAAQGLHLEVETIASKFGELPNHLPMPRLPRFNLEAVDWSQTFINGIAMALLGGKEALLSAVIGDSMTGGKHKSNCELVAQGLGNISSLFFGGLPATGTICRTTTNIKSGAQTPISGMVHALTLLAIVTFFSPIVSLIPLSALAAILVIVAWNMIDWPHSLFLLKGSKGDLFLLVTTFLLTVFVDVAVAITLGTILACFIFMKRRLF